jgi:Leucine rich repeat
MAIDFFRCALVLCFSASLVSAGVGKGCCFIQWGGVQSCTACGNETTAIDLNNHALTGLGSLAFVDLPKLAVVDVARNWLNGFPGDLFARNFGLNAVYLYYLSLATLPASLFKTNGALTLVDVHSSNVQQLPDDIFSDNPLLSTIDLSNNKLTSLSEKTFRTNTALTTLFLTSNQLTTLPDGIFTTNKVLQYLDLRGNLFNSSVCHSIFDQRDPSTSVPPACYSQPSASTTASPSSSISMSSSASSSASPSIVPVGSCLRSADWITNSPGARCCNNCDACGPLCLCDPRCSMGIPGSYVYDDGWTSTWGVLRQAPCPPGTFNSVWSSSSSACIPCAAGSFSDRWGKDQCDPCPANLACGASGATTCIPCSPSPTPSLSGSASGSVSASSSGSVTATPSLSSSTSPSQTTSSTSMPSTSGSPSTNASRSASISSSALSTLMPSGPVSRTPSTTPATVIVADAQNGTLQASPEVASCPNGGFALQLTSDLSAPLCLPGACPSGMYASRDACVPCPSAPDSWTITKPLLMIAGVLLGVLLLFAVVVWSIARFVGGTVAGGASRSFGLLVWLSITAQMLSQASRAASINILPESVRPLFGILAALQLSSLSNPAQCLGYSRYFAMDVVSMSAALSLQTLLAFIVLLSLKSDSARVRSYSRFVAMGLSALLSAIYSRVADSAVGVLHCTGLSLPMTAAASLWSAEVASAQLLSAPSADGIGMYRVLARDASIMCGVSPHKETAALAWACIVLFLVGFPLSVVWIATPSCAPAAPLHAISPTSSSKGSSLEGRRTSPPQRRQQLRSMSAAALGDALAGGGVYKRQHLWFPLLDSVVLLALATVSGVWLRPSSREQCIEKNITVTLIVGLGSGAVLFFQPYALDPVLRSTARVGASVLTAMLAAVTGASCAATFSSSSTPADVAAARDGSIVLLVFTALYAVLLLALTGRAMIVGAASEQRSIEAVSAAKMATPTQQYVNPFCLSSKMPTHPGSRPSADNTNSQLRKPSTYAIRIASGRSVWSAESVGGSQRGLTLAGRSLSGCSLQPEVDSKGVPVLPRNVDHQPQQPQADFARRHSMMPVQLDRSGYGARPSRAKAVPRSNLMHHVQSVHALRDALARSSMVQSGTVAKRSASPPSSPRQRLPVVQRSPSPHLVARPPRQASSPPRRVPSASSVSTSDFWASTPRDQTAGFAFRPSSRSRSPSSTPRSMSPYKSSYLASSNPSVRSASGGSTRSGGEVRAVGARMQVAHSLKLSN